jgi:hypothetical protein
MVLIVNTEILCVNFDKQHFIKDPEKKKMGKIILLLVNFELIRK